MFKRRLFAVVLLVGAAHPAFAQDIATRIFQMEERIRQLTGQVEELNFTVQQLQRQLGQKSQGQVLQQSGALAPQAPSKRQLLAPEDAAVVTDGSGIEVIEEAPAPLPKQKLEVIGSAQDGVVLEGGVQDFTKGGNGVADQGFDGQVLVPQGGESPAIAPQSSDGIETVSLEPSETPDAAYKAANEALLRRQFPEAEAGFRNFIEKYPEHSLAGSAQYWLGETFYVQGDVKQAAQNFLAAYKSYPKSRRAPDSLLKLGMSLAKMGQKDQACGALNSVATEFPRAVEAKKRATAEYKRAGC